jgi:hypothetical protein
VPLLARHGPIILQDLFDPFQKRPKLLPRSRLLLPVARRFKVAASYWAADANKSFTQSGEFRKVFGNSCLIKLR